MWLDLSPSTQLVADSPNLTSILCELLIYLPTQPPTNPPTNQPTYLPTYLTYLPTYLPTSVVISIKNLTVAHRMQKFAKFHTMSHNWTPFDAIIQSMPLRLIYFELIFVWCSPLHRRVHTGTGNPPPTPSLYHKRSCSCFLGSKAAYLNTHLYQ
jgi:hypothetical protein